MENTNMKTADVSNLRKEWEKLNNPFYPDTMRYTRESLEKFAEFVLSKSLPIEGGGTVTDEEKITEAIEFLKTTPEYNKYHTNTEPHICYHVAPLTYAKIMVAFYSTREAELLREIDRLNEKVEYWKKQFRLLDEVASTIHHPNNINNPNARFNNE